ncbi:hypothetical protein ABTP80_18155 [Acinetobacter baumannii]
MQQIGLPETIINAFVELDTENKNYWKILTDLDTPFDVMCAEKTGGFNLVN